MKRVLDYLIPLLVLVACGREEVPDPNGGLRLPVGEVYHGMIELGDKLEDPYTVENMREALTKAYPTKADRIDIRTTDLYVRFLPADDGQLRMLQEAGVYLLDHPMDYRIVKEGDYYRDPLLDEDSITWQYAVVDRDFSFPDGIRYEVLDECFISEHDPMTRVAHQDIDWTLVEREAFRLTGNEDLWCPPTKADGTPEAPHGRITIVDPDVSGGQPFGLAGVKVVANVFVKIGQAYTDRDGYYQMPQTFSSEPRYRLLFQNELGFSIGFNLIVIPASVSTLGSGGPEGIDYQIDAESDNALFRRSVVNNAAYEYYTRCPDLEVTVPPADLRLWIMPMLSVSSASMLHHGAFLDQSLIQQYLGPYLGLIRIFLPDITIGTTGMDRYGDIYNATVHELAHASHYAQVGNLYWGEYIRYVIESFVTQGGRAYGLGIGEGAGHCEVGEMWAYFLQASLHKDRYGGSMPAAGSGFWFHPEIFSYLYERGMTRGEIFRSLKPGVTSTDDLKEELTHLYPERETAILQTFTRYGK